MAVRGVCDDITMWAADWFCHRPDTGKDSCDVRHVFWVVIMSKRDIKAKRWLKRRLRREHGEWWKPLFAVLMAAEGKRPAMGTVMFLCGRRPGVKAASEIWDHEFAITGNAGDGAVAGVNMREVETLPLPERSTSKPYSGTNYTENIE